VTEALPARERRKRKLHPATRVFMGLRLAVNDELGRLARFLEVAPGCLRPGGRLAVISYHSLEDRMVKRAFARLIDPCTCPPDLPVCGCGAVPLADPVSKGAMKPSPGEVADNPRSRSARLRAVKMKEAVGP
jgi:16S rRNA (cytosine1402-N4)-methyltransferase